MWNYDHKTYQRKAVFESKTSLQKETKPEQIGPMAHELDKGLMSISSYYVILQPTLQPTETAPAYKLNLRWNTRRWL